MAGTRNGQGRRQAGDWVMEERSPDPGPIEYECALHNSPESVPSAARAEWIVEVEVEVEAVRLWGRTSEPVAYICSLAKARVKMHGAFSPVRTAAERV